MKYIAFSTLLIPSTAITPANTAGLPYSAAETAINSFTEKPAKNGMPTMDKAAAVKNTPAFFALFPLPLSFSNSRLSPETAASRGVVMNRSDFVTA